MTPPRPICGIGLALSNHLAFFLVYFWPSLVVRITHTHSKALGLYGASSKGLAGANKNFIGIVEVNNELPINPRPICGSTRLAFPGSFILALAQFVKPAPTATNVATYSVGLVWQRKLCMAVHNAGF